MLWTQGKEKSTASVWKNLKQTWEFRKKIHSLLFIREKSGGSDACLQISSALKWTELTNHCSDWRLWIKVLWDETHTDTILQRWREERSAAEKKVLQRIFKSGQKINDSNFSSLKDKYYAVLWITLHPQTWIAPLIVKDTSCILILMQKHAACFQFI